MSMSKTRRGRLRQIERWLNDTFPTPRPTTVRVCDIRHGKRGSFGDTDRLGNRTLIRIHSKLTWDVAIYALFEEWAHAVTWPLASVEDYGPHHDHNWGCIYADIITAWERGGYIESRTYSDK
jgi:hypothetical protein